MYSYFGTHLFKKLLPVCLLLLSVTAQAQPLNNEWINYSQTYYKFKVGRNGLCRISQAILQANGMAAVNAQNFQLWRNGEQVPVYTSVASGPLGSSDFIEFYGILNDGKPDKVLYEVAANQLNDRVSLQTDSSTYFLTYNTTQTGLRYTAAVNNVAGNTLTPVPYFTHTEKYDFKEMVSRGFADPSPGEYIYSSSYDVGEMVSTNEIYSANNSGYVQPVYTRVFYPYAAGGNCTVKVGAMGVAPNLRTVDFQLNNNTLGSMSLLTFEAKSQTYTNVPVSYLPTGSGTYAIKNLCANTNDRVAVSYIDITYPRLFKFSDQRWFDFELPANASGQYLEITNFDRGNAQPILYDITNRRRYVTEVNAAGIIRVALPATSATTNYALISQDAGAILPVSLQQRSFLNYSSSALQGDYLIISNNILSAPVNGANPVEQYRLYRNSAAGGVFNSKIYDIDQLEDQFAFGIKKHPLSVKNFLRFARQTFSVQPKFIFLIGKGVSYQDYRFSQNTPAADRLNLVPTFGYPGSDVMLSASGYLPYPTTPIGRLSVIAGQEIIDYLDKVKTYETVQAGTLQTQQDKLWMKNIVHVVGASDAGTASLIAPPMERYANIIQDTLYGAKVTTLNKYSGGQPSNINSQIIGNLFQTGMSLLTYFGHSSASSLDYNLEDPANYNNPGKYPMFMLLGCNAGNFFTLDTTRFAVKSTISEKYVLAQNRGSIGLIASTSFGLVGELDVYSTGFYNSVGKTAYGQSIGKHVQDASQYVLNATNNSFHGRNHAAQQTLHGDPAIKLNSELRPDYSVEEPNIFINPTVVSVDQSQFKVKIYHYNLGKAINDSITVQVKRQYPSSPINPNGLTEVVYNQKIKATRFTDSLEVSLPIIANRDKGTNKIIVSVETENRIQELSENNNTASRDVVIFEDEMRPIYPYNFAIVNRQNIKLTASTSSPVLATARPYRMELDTTEFFNSPLKVTRNVNTTGGIVELDPGVTFRDSTVYYWRIAVVPAVGNPDRWNTFSFVYLAGSTSIGFNQSHVYQHLKSGAERIYIDSNSRKWEYLTRNNNLFITHSVYPVSGTEDGHFSISVNNDVKIKSACYGSSIIFNVFDPIGFAPMVNNNGQYGSVVNTCGIFRQYNFEWYDKIPANRKLMMDFMDAIPNGSYVVARKILSEPFNAETLVSDMKKDTLIYGSGQSLYHKLKQYGFAGIDSFYRPRIWAFVYKKNDPSYTPTWKFSEGLERIQMNAYCPTPDTLGFITSPVFGPAANWKQVKWRGTSQDVQLGDNPMVSVVGVTATGAETVLYNLNQSQQDFDISGVSPVQYPFIRLRMRNADSINGTAYNLRYWRLLYDPVPEGALAANILFKTKDSLEVGETLDFSIAFKNVSDVKFRDSIKVKAIILDQSNVPHNISISRKKDLQPGDTTTVNVKLDTKDYPGVNNLFLEMNPVDSSQPEQYHFNNFIYRDFYVKPDKYNPLLDVTFDGVHILNKDIVSSRPHIQVKLKDESRYLLLNDTSLLRLTLRFPDGSTRTYRFGTDTLRFTPAAAGTTDNTATIDFYPALDQDSEGQYYEMTITAKDRANNAAGPDAYRVSFQVFNKPMISNMFNYPNPFTTSTAFVFTITGKEIPQEFKIQILTITGKIVREVTKAELGPLNIGRNITEFKWDGTDQYGSKLANGVYLFRVVAGLNGSKMDQFRINRDFDQSAQDETDKFFNKGYGKMYLMR